MSPQRFREMFVAMTQNRGWLTDQEIEARIVDLRNGAAPVLNDELARLSRVMYARKS